MGFYTFVMKEQAPSLYFKLQNYILKLFVVLLKSLTYSFSLLGIH